MISIKILDYLVTNFLNGILVIVLFNVAYLIFNLITPKWDFSNVFTKDKITNGGLIIAVYFAAIAFVLAIAVF